jgi:hypothetical protein
MAKGTELIHLIMDRSLYFLKGFHAFTHQLSPQGFLLQSVLSPLAGMSDKGSKICLSLQFLLGGHKKSVLFLNLGSFLAHYVNHPFELITCQSLFSLFLDLLYIALSSHNNLLQFSKGIILSHSLQVLYCPLSLSP